MSRRVRLLGQANEADGRPNHSENLAVNHVFVGHRALRLLLGAMQKHRFNETGLHLLVWHPGTGFAATAGIVCVGPETSQSARGMRIEADMKPQTP